VGCRGLPTSTSRSKHISELHEAIHISICNWWQISVYLCPFTVSRLYPMPIMRKCPPASRTCCPFCQKGYPSCLFPSRRTVFLSEIHWWYLFHKELKNWLYKLVKNSTISNPGLKTMSSNASPSWTVYFLVVMIGVFSKRNSRPTLTYYWTVALILDHSYFVGKWTKLKISGTEVSWF
jgi:hypothetical protein